MKNTCPLSLYNFSNVKHRSKECPKKIEVHNTFKTKPISSHVMTHLNHLKLTMCQLMLLLLLLPLAVGSWNNICLQKYSQLKLKELKIGNNKRIYEIHSLKLSDNYNMVS